jgi:hypothetical protein
MRWFSKLHLPSLLKYGEIRYDFKFLKENLALITNNSSNRGSDCNPFKVTQLWENYKKQMFDLDKLRKLKNTHTEE